MAFSFVCLFLCFGFIGSLQAQAPITWETPTATKNIADIRVTNSPFVEAINGGSSLGIAGIEFTGGTFDDLPSSMTFRPTSATASTASAGLSESTGNANYDTLLNRMAYTTSGETEGTIEFSGLTVGQDYQIQLWYSDQRGTGTNRSMIFGDDGVSTATVTVAAATGDFGENVVGSFTAVGTTQIFSMETSGFGNVHINALTLSEGNTAQSPLDPIQGSSWIIDSLDQWNNAVERASSDYLIAGGLATSATANSIFESRVQPFESKQKFQNMIVRQSRDWNANKWEDTDDDISPGSNNAMVFVVPGEGDYIAIDRFGSHYHLFHSTNLTDWEHKGVIGDGYRWVTTAEYHDGKLFIYHDDFNDHDPTLVTIDYVAGSGEFFDANGNLTNSTSEIAVTDYGIVLAKPEVTIDGTTYSLAGGSDNAIFRDPADGQFHMIYENWSRQNAQRFSWDSNIASQSISPDGINGFVFDEATRIINRPGNLITQDQATNPDSYTQGDGSVITLTYDGVLYYVGHHPNRRHLFQLTDQTHAWGDHSIVKIGEMYYLFVDDDSEEEGIGLGYWYGESLSEEFTYGGRILDGVHPDPDIGFAEGNFQLLVQGGNNDLRSFGPWTQGVEAQAGVDTDGDGVVDIWTDWQAISEQYRRIDGFTKAFELEEAVLDLSSLPQGFGIAFRLRSEFGNVSFDSIEISSDAISSVPEIVISNNEVQRSMLTEIGVLVGGDATFEDGAFELVKRGSDGGAVDLTVTPADSDSGTRVILDFSGQFTESSGSLVDGNYELTIDGDNILCEGNPLDVDGDGTPGGLLVIGDEAADNLYRLFGDADRNRNVNIFDLLGFRQTYRLMTGDASFNSSFDSNLDGFVNIFDLLRFRQNYRTSLSF